MSARPGEFVLVPRAVLEDAADKVKRYAETVHHCVKADDLEFPHYVPAIEETEADLRDLLAQPAPSVDEAAVERAAAALFHARYHEAFSWDKASGGERDMFRTHARAALSAADTQHGEAGEDRRDALGALIERWAERRRQALGNGYERAADAFGHCMATLQDAIATTKDTK